MATKEALQKAKQIIDNKIKLVRKEEEDNATCISAGVCPGCSNSLLKTVPSAILGLFHKKCYVCNKVWAESTYGYREAYK